MEAGLTNPFKEPRKLVMAERVVKGYAGNISQFTKRYDNGLAAIQHAVSDCYNPDKKPEKVVKKASKQVIKNYPELHELKNYIEYYIFQIVNQL